MRIQKLMRLHRLMGEAGDGTGGSGDGGGSGAGSDQGTGGAAEGSAGETGDKQKGKPSDEEARLLKEVMSKKKNLLDAQAKISELEAQVKKFEGIDPEAVRAMLEEKANKEREQLEAKGEWSRLREQMAAAHEGEKSKIVEQLKAREAETEALRAQIAEMTVGSAFGSSKFISDELILTPSKARVIYGAHFEFSDGKVVAFDKPAGAADRTMLVDGKGDPLSFEESIAKIVGSDPEKDKMIRSKVKPGVGSHTSQKPGVDATKSEIKVTGRNRIAAAMNAAAKTAPMK